MTGKIQSVTRSVAKRSLHSPQAKETGMSEAAKRINMSTYYAFHLTPVVFVGVLIKIRHLPRSFRFQVRYICKSYSVKGKQSRERVELIC